MASKRVIAICQSGGEFVKNSDGTLSYNGGEAYAVDLDEQTQLENFKKEVAEMFNCGFDNMTIKYFIPGNKRTLITISKDRDLTRMVSFVKDSETVDVFIIVEEPLSRNVLNMPASRSKRTTVSEAIAPNKYNAPNMTISGKFPMFPHGNKHQKAAQQWENAVSDIDQRSSGSSGSEAVTPDGIVDTVMENLNEIRPVNIPDGIVDAVMENLNAVMVTTSGSSPASSRSKKIQKAPQQWENAITGVDQRFGSFKEFRETLHKYSIAHGFSYKYKKNNSHRVTVKCKSEGCKWRIYASRLATTQLICIKRMVDDHTCEGNNINFGNRATRAWVGGIIKEKLKKIPHYKPKDIADDIEKEFGVQISYTQARRVKNIAKEELQGSHRESYSRLPLLCDRIKETNPGSRATLITKENSSFHRLFISFHASITGFEQGCRPLVFLDSVPLTSKYPGELLAALSADGDDGLFPISFAIVDAKTTDNWRWFLEELKASLSLSHPITFVADFENGLKETVPEVFGNAYHSYCLRYMAEKLNKDLKGHLSHEARRLMLKDFYAAAYATKIEDFQRSIDDIKAISSEAYDLVVKTEPKHWSNAFFEGVRYNLLTTKFCQLFFDWVSEVDDLPITQVIDFLRGKMAELMNSRRMESNEWGTRLTPLKEEKMEKEILKAQSLQVLRSHDSMFEVHGESSHVVDINGFGCSCKEWQLTGLPCCHAVAVFQFIGRNPYDFCSKYFTVESYRLTYAESIEPVPSVGTLLEGEKSGTTVPVTPPPCKRVIGRPRTKPTESEDISKQHHQCSKCKGFGHNKKTCKGLNLYLLSTGSE